MSAIASAGEDQPSNDDNQAAPENPSLENAYQRHRDRAAKRDRAGTATGRDIGKLGPNSTVPHRTDGRTSIRSFWKSYLPTHAVAWTKEQERLAAALESVDIKDGGAFARVMPRGGANPLHKVLWLWAVMYGFPALPLLLTGGSDDLRSWLKSQLETNKSLLRDFPDVCYPIQCWKKGTDLGDVPFPEGT